MARLLRLAPDVTAGSVSALVTLSYSVSYAVLVFSGPTLEPFLAKGFRAALVAAALIARRGPQELLPLRDCWSRLQLQRHPRRHGRGPDA